ncbi:MAG TPA: hypothetical protein VLE45_12110 [Burkholderiaceae bacterium]|nr:hypothetical protein [Burkholderiaceae bacterium]
MPRASTTLLVLILCVLLPLRAVAGVVIGYCASGHQQLPVAAHVAQGSHAAHGDHAGHAAHAGHDQHAASALEEGDGQPVKPVTSTCSTCAEHCSSAAFAPGCAPQAQAVPAAAQASPRDDVRAAPAFIPDQLDRPPLA